MTQPGRSYHKPACSSCYSTAMASDTLIATDATSPGAAVFSLKCAVPWGVATRKLPSTATFTVSPISPVMFGKAELLAEFAPEELTPKFRALLDLYFDQGVQPCAPCELYAGNPIRLRRMFATPALYERNVSRFMLIGQATGTGSHYVLLRPDVLSPVDEWPVLVSGDEGGVGVLAVTLDDWLRYMALNMEPYVEAQGTYDLATNIYTYQTATFDLEEEPGEMNEAYLNWLTTEWGLSPVISKEQAETEIIGPAQQRYQAEVDYLVGSGVGVKFGE